MLRTMRTRLLAASVSLFLLATLTIGAAPLSVDDTLDTGGVWLPGMMFFLMPLPLAPDVADAPQPDEGRSLAVNGACCLGTGLCTQTSEVKCDLFGGSYQGDGTSCDACGVPVDGACCLGVGGYFVICSETSLSDCQQRGGAWAGPGTTCPEWCGFTPPFYD